MVDIWVWRFDRGPECNRKSEGVLGLMSAAIPGGGDVTRVKSHEVRELWLPPRVDSLPMDVRGIGLHALDFRLGAFGSRIESIGRNLQDAEDRCRSDRARPDFTRS